MTAQRVATEIQALKQFLIQAYNPQVKEDFREDIDLDIGNWDSWSEEQQLLYLLQIKPTDTEGRMLLRILTFMFVRGSAKLNADIFGIPVDNFLENIKLKPQIQLIFLEKPAAQKAANRSYPLRLKAAIRIRQEVPQITKAEIDTFLDRILLAFTNPYHKVDKGRNIYSYRDRVKGYQLKFYLLNLAEAKTLIDKILSIQGDQPDWTNLHENLVPEADWATPGKTPVLGKLVDNPRQRVPGAVYLRRVELLLPPAKPRLLARITPQGVVTRMAI